MNDIIKVYATCFWQDDISLLKQIKKWGNGSLQWKNIVFCEENKSDITAIFTAPYNGNKVYSKQNTVLFLTEPPQSPWHIDGHDYFICPMYLTASFWYDSSYNDKGTRIEKTKLFSSVTSDLYWLDGHQKRLEFILYLDKIIREGFDLYGKGDKNSIFSKIKSYKGELTDKFDGVIPYKYHFACENSFLPDYFSEKILDPIIGESLCFYDGCSNMEEFIDERAFIRLDIKDKQKSVETIIKAIEENEYEKRFQYILKEKERILKHLNPLNIIWAQLNEKNVMDYFKITASRV